MRYVEINKEQIARLPKFAKTLVTTEGKVLVDEDTYAALNLLYNYTIKWDNETIVGSGQYTSAKEATTKALESAAVVTKKNVVITVYPITQS